jgi:flavin-dependent dehydrogenase
MSEASNDAVDVIVVGGGVAGASTAIACSQRGLKTLLIEFQPDAKDLPGETLHPGIQPLFHVLGIEERVNAEEFLRHPGYCVRSREAAFTHLYGADARGEWHGYQADRAKLQAILRNRAEESGTTIMRGERVICPVYRKRRIAGVVSTAGTHRSRFVVDATGHAHWLTRQFRSPMLELSPRLIAFFGWVAVEGSRTASGTLPEFTMNNGAWDWTAPVLKNKDAWVHLNLESVPHHSRPAAHVARPKPLADLRSVGRTSARDVTWRIARPAAGPGYFLTGEAAWVLDPASSHGVLFAMMSGMAAADAMVKLLGSPEDEERVLAGYSAWAEDRFCRDAAALISLYSAMEGAPKWLSSATKAVRYIAMSSSERAFSRSASYT